MKLKWDKRGLELRLSDHHSLYFYPLAWGLKWENEGPGEFKQLTLGPFQFVHWRWPQA